MTGVTLRLWGGESDSGCCSVSDVDDARRVADHLGLDHHVFNFGPDFERHVVEPYVRDHRAGRTPNPCIECNRHLKFDRLLRRADQLGFDAVATGHHARIAGRAGRLRVARGADPGKDQSYVLHMLDQATLARTLFPIGGLTKDRVRAMAAELGLRTAAKPDSQDVCFITSAEGRAAFLGRRTAAHPRGGASTRPAPRSDGCPRSSSSRSASGEASACPAAARRGTCCGSSPPPRHGDGRLRRRPARRPAGPRAGELGRPPGPRRAARAVQRARSGRAGRRRGADRTVR